VLETNASNITSWSKAEAAHGVAGSTKVPFYPHETFFLSEYLRKT